jgi:hypothetical protein
VVEKGNPTGVTRSVSIFDGRTLTGWHSVGAGLWKVEDGAIVGQCKKGDGIFGLLFSDGEFDDFTLRMEVEIDAGNSGVYFRAREGGWAGAGGLQVELWPPAWLGALHWNDTVSSDSPRWVQQNPPDPMQHYWRQSEWNNLELTAQGAKIDVTINGVTTARWDGVLGDSTGRFALQVAGLEQTEVRFRRITVERLPPKPTATSGEQ